MWPHRKKSIGVRSSDPGGQAAVPPSLNPAIVSGCEMLILKRFSLVVLLRKLQPSGSNLAFLIARVCLCCIVVGCVLGWMVIFFEHLL